MKDWNFEQPGGNLQLSVGILLEILSVYQKCATFRPAYFFNPRCCWSVCDTATCTAIADCLYSVYVSVCVSYLAWSDGIRAWVIRQNIRWCLSGQVRHCRLYELSNNRFSATSAWRLMMDSTLLCCTGEQNACCTHCTDTCIQHFSHFSQQLSLVFIRPSTTLSAIWTI